jgi:adenylate kinase
MQQEDTPRSLPVIAITGTPGTGKTTHAQLLVEQSPVPLQHINVSELVKEKMLHDGFDEEWQTFVVDEDKVCSYSSSWLGTGMMCQI